MTAIDANGITIEYESRGDGEPLLLVMGLGGQLIDWPDEFVDGLVAAGFRVITFDNRDIGLSTEFTWEAPSQVKAVLGSMARRPVKSEYLLTRHGGRCGRSARCARRCESAHVVGMSMGGMIAQTIAIEHAGTGAIADVDHVEHRRPPERQDRAEVAVEDRPAPGPDARDGRRTFRRRRSGWCRGRTSTSPSTV